MYTRSLQQLARKFQQASSSPTSKESKTPHELLFTSPTTKFSHPYEEADYDSTEDNNQQQQESSFDSSPNDTIDNKNDNNPSSTSLLSNEQKNLNTQIEK